MPIDDELLVAYADGELDAEQSARVERAVNEDPVLQARLLALTRAAELTRELFEAKSREPVPPELVERIMAGGDAPTRQLEEPRRSLGERLADWWRIPLPAAAFGALTLLAVGGLLGYLLPSGTPTGGSITTAGLVPADSALHLLLQEYPGGTTLADGPLNLEAVATFVDGDRICREYRAIRDTGPHEYHAGIACRGDGNDWRVAFAVDEYLAEEPVGGFYETASNKLHEAIDGFIEEYLDVDPLDDAAERALIERGWRSGE
jgi:hypothetical protein